MNNAERVNTKVKWLEMFLREYLKRTGITYCAGDDEAVEKYFESHSPTEAVSHEIIKYDLEEIGN